jgi:hypothetical protein
MSCSPLYGGVKALLTCDGGEVVSGIVSFVISQNRVLRLLSRVMRRAGGTPIATAIILINGLRCYLGVSLRGEGDAVMVARRPNERRAIVQFMAMAGRSRFAELAIAWQLRPMWRALAVRARSLPRDCRRMRRLAGALSRRYGVFHALRVVELIAYYSRYLELIADQQAPAASSFAQLSLSTTGSPLPRSREPRTREPANREPARRKERRFRLAVMSTHSNPHGIALNLAARRRGVPIVLITHGMPIRPLARLPYDLAIHECAASSRIYVEAGCGMERVIVKSRRGDHAPICPPVAGALTAGVFLSKDPVDGRVMSCLRALSSDGRVSRILVRPHPVNLWRDLPRRLASLGEPRIVLQAGTSLRDDLRQCDVVIAGNSTVLLDAVVAGRPACYVRGLDHGAYDVQDFVRDDLVYEWHAPTPLDLGAIAEYYARREWPRILRQYADVDRREEDVAADVRAALEAIDAAEIGAVA